MTTRIIGSSTTLRQGIRSCKSDFVGRQATSRNSNILHQRISSSSCRYFSSSDTTSTSNSSHDDVVLVSVDSTTGIAHVELNRPDKLNALNMDMFHAIQKAGQQVRDDSSIRAVILSGKGRAFCTGLDVKSVFQKPIENTNTLLKRNEETNKEETIKAPKAKDDIIDIDDDTMNTLLDPDRYTEIANLAQDVGYIWRTVPAPVICVLQGMCFGGGMQIALGCDFRIAAADTKLSIMEAKWGLIPDMSASITLRELVRIDVAKELTMTGRIVSAQEAADIGLITRVVKEDDDPFKNAQQLANDIVKRSPDSVALTKQLYHRTWHAESDVYCLKVETALQKKLLMTWNQFAASGRSAMGWNIPYFQRKEHELEEEDIRKS